MEGNRFAAYQKCKEMRKGVAVVGYIRTATPDNKDILQKQKDNIASFCLQNKLFLARVFEDNGASGADFHRKGWSDLKKFLSEASGSVTYLVVDEPSRVGRNYSNVEKEISRLKEDFDITVVPVREALGLVTRLKRELSNKKRGRKL